MSEPARFKRLLHAGLETGIPMTRQRTVSKTRAFPAGFSPIRSARPAHRSTHSRPARHFESRAGEDGRAPMVSDKVGDKDSNLKL